MIYVFNNFLSSKLQTQIFRGWCFSPVLCPACFILFFFFFQTKSGLKVASKRGKMEESIMLSWEMEDDLGLGSSKVETLDSFNWFLWAPTNFVLEILAIHRTVSINIQNRADLCHQVMKNYSQDWSGFKLLSWITRAPSWWVAQACPVVWLPFQRDMFIPSCILGTLFITLWLNINIPYSPVK